MKKTLRAIAVAMALIARAAAGDSDGSVDQRNHYILCDDKCIDAIAPGTQGELYAQSAVDVAIGAPGAVASDANGNVYFTSEHIVFRLDVAGTLTRIAGNATPGYSGDGGRAIDALLNMPSDYPKSTDEPPAIGGLAIDAAGNVYVSDWYNGRVRRITPSGIITTVVGGAIGWPAGLAIDSSGNLYIAAGGLYRLAGDGALQKLFDWNCGTPPGTPGLCAPEQMAIDATGSLYIAEECAVSKLATDGVLTTFAGTRSCGFAGDGGPAVFASLGLLPFAVTVDSIGNLYIADTFNNCIRKVDVAGIINTVAGRCRSYGGYSGDDGKSDHAALLLPSGIAVDASGNLYIADTYNRRLRKVAPNGIITTVAGNGEALTR